MWTKEENEKNQVPRISGDEFLWWFCSWCASQNFLWQVFLFLEIASLKSMLNYWRVEQIHPNCFRTDCWWCQNLCCFCPELLSQKKQIHTWPFQEPPIFQLGSWPLQVMHQISSISDRKSGFNYILSRGNNFHWTHDDAFRGGDLHICERSCALDVQTELHFWGIDDLHLEVDVLSSSDLLRNSYS